jgi:hypothetical protein
MIQAPLNRDATRLAWIANAMNVHAGPLDHYVARTPDGDVFATVRLVDGTGKNFLVSAIHLGMPVGLLFVCSFAYPVGFVFVAILILQISAASKRLARIEVEGGSWWYANRSTIWQLMKAELFVLMFHVLALYTLSGIFLPTAFTIAGAIQVINIQGRINEKNFPQWLDNAVKGLEQEYARSGRGGTTGIVEVLVDLPVTREELSDMQSQMRADFDRLESLSPFDAARPELIKAWKDSNTGYLEHLLQEGDNQTRASWDDAIGIFNAAKDSVDVARSGLRQSVAAAETALVAYTIDEASIVVERSGSLEGAMRAAQLAPKTLTQKLNYGRGSAMMATKAFTGNVPWQVAAGAAVLSLIMMAVNHSKLMRQLKGLEGQLVGQAEAVRGDITLIESELRLRLIPQFDGLAALLGRLQDGLANLGAAEALVGHGNAKAEAFHLACAVREANYLLEMKAGN